MTPDAPREPVARDADLAAIEHDNFNWRSRFWKARDLAREARDERDALRAAAMVADHAAAHRSPAEFDAAWHNLMALVEKKP